MGVAHHQLDEASENWLLQCALTSVLVAKSATGLGFTLLCSANLESGLESFLSASWADRLNFPTF